jgi:lipopolysaccharide/colanic/teichoic acid biosynthesis glycosyltransferase
MSIDEVTEPGDITLRIVRQRAPRWHTVPEYAGGTSPAAGIGPGPARRALDAVVATVGLLICGLPLLALLLAVRLTSRGPALFRQVRLGQGGRPFVLYKLRSMRANSSGPEFTPAADERVTRLGRILRSTSLDELPQLWHVLRGQMTLVGPRPETPGLAAGYPPECRWIFAYRPGLTGPAQVRTRDADLLGPVYESSLDAYFNLIVPARTAMEASYLANPTMKATFGVLADTVRHLLGAKLPVRAAAAPESLAVLPRQRLGQ